MPIRVTQLGNNGVNVDKNPLELDDNELRQAQNAIHNTMGTGLGIRKRPGLGQFNTDDAAGPVLGGTTVPLIDRFSGFSTLYLGRGGPV
jgi:hypothetical protein